MHHLRRLTVGAISKSRRKCLGRSTAQNTTRCSSTTKNPPIANMLPQFTIPKGIFGQPTYHTHPHLLAPGYLTCGITQLEYKERRDNLVHKLVSEAGNMHCNHIIVIPAAPKQYMSDKIPYAFRQNSDFFYLTGCLEPSAVLVLVKPADNNSYKSVLFVHDKDSHAELWEGPRTGCIAAAQLFAVDEARPVGNFNQFINRTTSQFKPATLWYHNESPVNQDIHLSISSVLRQGGAISLADPQKTLHFLRLTKSPAEVELMKETCYIGSQAMNVAMAYTKPGISEHMLNALLEYSCRQAGAEHQAYPPVVAGGPRATHIHYITNNQLLAADEMVLIDAGSQRWLYNSDVSRTWPVSGKFSNPQRILYEIVLLVQKRLIELLGEQRPALDSLFDSMCRLLGMYLQQEGILPKNIDSNELIERAYRLCPHHVSHYLGLDVHDTPLVRRRIPVHPNMVVTVEPGIYIREDDTSAPSEFRGVGIRIEDDVLITEGDPLVLTSACVKEVEDVEAVVGKHSL